MWTKPSYLLRTVALAMLICSANLAANNLVSLDYTAEATNIVTTLNDPANGLPADIQIGDIAIGTLQYNAGTRAHITHEFSGHFSMRRHPSIGMSFQTESHNFIAGLYRNRLSSLGLYAKLSKQNCLDEIHDGQVLQFCTWGLDLTSDLQPFVEKSTRELVNLDLFLARLIR